MYAGRENTCVESEKRNQVCMPAEKTHAQETKNEIRYVKNKNKAENVRNTMQITAMKKDDFYRQMFKLTIPIIIQNLLSAAVNSADVIILNYV